jgi:3',5'-cyclic AMP phosphodiesterase CpdA
VSVKVAIVTDIHAGSDNAYIKGTLSFDLLQQALTDLQRYSPDLLVDLGDRSNDDHVYDLVNYLQKLGPMFSGFPAPRQHLLGNHDFLHPAMQQKYLGSWPENTSLELGAWHLVFLNAFDGSVNGTLTPSDLDWLEATLCSKNLPTVVFTHQPLDGQPGTINELFKDFPHWVHTEHHQRAREVLEASGKVQLVLSGHVHQTHLETVSGIHYVTLDSLVPSARDEGGGACYALLELDQNHIQLQTFGKQARSFVFSNRYAKG